MEIFNTGYYYYVVPKSKTERSEVYVSTIQPKGLGQRFEERRNERPADDVFNIIQKRPNTIVHLKVDEAMENRRSH